MGLWDAHTGYDRIYRKGKYVLQPAHNEAAINAAISFIKDYDPDLVILGGDMVNCASISHHNRGRARYKEGMRLKEEMDLCAKLILDPIQQIVRPRTKLVWHHGNHEKWVDDHVQEFPELEGLLSLAEYLKLEERGYEVKDYGEAYQIGGRNGKVWTMHGENTKGANHAKSTVSEFHRNMRYGHHHTYQVATEISPMDVKDFHTAISVPCLANRNPGYAQNKPNRHIHGLLYGESLGSGAFQDSVIVMVDSKFILNGRVYEG